MRVNGREHLEGSESEGRREGNVYSLSLHTDDSGASPDASDPASCHEVCHPPRARCHPPPSV